MTQSIEVTTERKTSMPTPASAPIAGPRLVVLTTVADLLGHRDAWDKLAGETAEPNVFFEPSVLLPSLRAFGGTRDLALVLVYLDGVSGPTKTPTSQLIGFFPLEKRTLFGAKLICVHRLWEGDYSYVPTPLLHREHGAVALRAFFDWLDEQPRGASLLAIDRLILGGAFHGLLIDEVARRRAHVLVRDSFTRAHFDPDCTAEVYLSRVLSSKDRRELQRQRKRLQEQGATLVSLQSQDDVDRWANDFLALEASGWKGRGGSAMASDPADASFFREMVRDCYAAGKLSSTAWVLDGKPIAMQILLHSGRGAYGFKTCYDESFGRFAPGLLLEIDLIERASDMGLRWIDSAAAHYHPVFNRIYRERRCVERWLLSPDHAAGLGLSAWSVARWLRRSLSERKTELARSVPEVKQGRQLPDVSGRPFTDLLRRLRD
ncbi:MAG TPA: GNAT family N-acetyltransferase [Polyangia bacterium]